VNEPISARGPRPVLTVYVAWHPSCDDGKEFAEALFRDLCADPEIPARRGLGIPVRFRTATTNKELPSPVPADSAERVAVFVLVDDEFAGSPDWREYGDRLAGLIGRETTVVPVALTDPRRLPAGLAKLQAIRLDGAPASNRYIRLRNRVFHDLCRLLQPDSGPVEIFLSHAKADGVETTKEVRRYLNEEEWLDSFFDEADIPDGAPFAEFLARAVSTAPILLAIQTDSYASREWCRLEVLEAKKHSIPIVVLAAMQRGETRSFPYMGNVPVVRWTDGSCLPDLAGAMLREVLRVRYFPLRVQHACRLQGFPAYDTFVHPPELVTALLYRERLVDSPGESRYLYPDPPLGTEELSLLQMLDPSHQPLTPTTLGAV
jgi:hypothetical protein